MHGSSQDYFCSLPTSSDGGAFSLDLLQCIQQRKRENYLLCAFLPVPHPRGVGSAPQRCQHPWGAAAGLTAPASFIAQRWEQNYFYPLFSLLSAPPPARGDGRGLTRAFLSILGCALNLFARFCPCPGCLGTSWCSAALALRHPVSIPPAPVWVSLSW